MYGSTNYDFKKLEPFLVPFSNIPYICNGSVGGMMRGASCFALFILEHQKRKEEMVNTLDYLFSEEECVKELSISSKITIEERFGKTENFLDKHFPFFRELPYENSTKLFVFTTFLDQLATDCFQYIEFADPTISNYIEAYKNIELLAEHKGIKKDDVRIYKSELLEILSTEKPNVYTAILFTAA